MKAWKVEANVRRNTQRRMSNKCYVIVTHLVCLALLLNLPIASAVASGRGAFSTATAGTRSNTFGQAFVAVADDANTARWNPAGLPSLLQTEFTFAHTNLFTFGGGYFDYASASDSINQDFVGVAFPNSRLPVGISYLNISTHGLITADARGSILDRNAGYAERLLTLSFGKNIARLRGYKVALGFNLNHYRVDARRDRSGVGADAGVLIRTPRFFPTSSAPQIGVMLHGLTRDVGLDNDEEGEGIPPRINLGLAYRFLGDGLTLAGGASKTSGDSDWQYAVGAEYQLRYLYPIYLSIRSAYQSRGDHSTGGIVTDVGEWTVGGSVHINRLKLDYAYAPHNFIGETHRMTVSILSEPPTAIYWRRGRQHDAMLEDDAALAAFQQLVTLNPRSAKAYHRMALIYERKRQIQEAIGYLERVRKTDADYFAEHGLEQFIVDLQDQR
jgi:tetratricopeptide (TPR) repeat protein